MDAETTTRLESIRNRTPRYLFRAWNDTSSKRHKTPSGGFPGLNTTEKVCPLAFARNQGHASVYDMKKEAFTIMTQSHLRGLHRPLTQFSSWSASLAFVVHHMAAHLGAHDPERQEHVHIAIIDTKRLGKSGVPIFYVPELDFLKPSAYEFPHEFLAHGVIKGPWYKAVPFSTFAAAGLSARFMQDPQYFPIQSGGSALFNPITKESLERALKVADQYGEKLRLPMFLALVCWEKRELFLFENGRGVGDFLPAVEGIRIPAEWATDRVPEVDRRYGDVYQFANVMRYLSKHAQDGSTNLADRWAYEAGETDGKCRESGFEAEESDEELVRAEPFTKPGRSGKRKLEAVKTAQEEEEAEDHGEGHVARKPVKRARCKETGLERELKALKIDMKNWY